MADKISVGIGIVLLVLVIGACIAPCFIEGAEDIGAETAVGIMAIIFLVGCGAILLIFMGIMGSDHDFNGPDIPMCGDR